MRDMHQICWDRDRLLVTCSFDDMVAIYDGERWDRWFPRGEAQTDDRDIHHFNSITRFPDGLCILAHNKGHSELVFFSDPGEAESASLRLGNQAHNIWKSGDEWLTCSSMDGRIIGHLGTSVLTGGFPRGVLALGDKLVVGISQIAERKERDFTSGALLLYDTRWNLLKRIDLPGEGLVLDLLEL
jgi:hypothetical protein